MHYLWKEHTGNLLHQRISHAVALETAKIAEIGTGTGFVTSLSFTNVYMGGRVTFKWKKMY